MRTGDRVGSECPGTVLCRRRDGRRAVGDSGFLHGDSAVGRGAQPGIPIRQPPNSRSSTAATSSATSSSPGLATICADSGRPSADRPRGTAAAGKPRGLTNAVSPRLPYGPQENPWRRAVVANTGRRSTAPPRIASRNRDRSSSSRPARPDPKARTGGPQAEKTAIVARHAVPTRTSPRRGGRHATRRRSACRRGRGGSPAASGDGRWRRPRAPPASGGAPRAAGPTCRPPRARPPRWSRRRRPGDRREGRRPAAA